VAIRITDLDTDPDPDPDRDTGKTCLGGGMNCHSASSFYIFCSFVFTSPVSAAFCCLCVPFTHCFLFHFFIIICIFLCQKINLIWFVLFWFHEEQVEKKRSSTALSLPSYQCFQNWYSTYLLLCNSNYEDVIRRALQDGSSCPQKWQLQDANSASHVARLYSSIHLPPTNLCNCSLHCASSCASLFPGFNVIYCIHKSSWSVYSREFFSIYCFWRPSSLNIRRNESLKITSGMRFTTVLHWHAE